MATSKRSNIKNKFSDKDNTREKCFRWVHSVTVIFAFILRVPLLFVHHKIVLTSRSLFRNYPVAFCVSSSKMQNLDQLTEAVAWRCSVKKVFLEIS